MTINNHHRILALDGGGIRGAITLGYLEKIEVILRERYQKPDFRLCDYYDLIGGTSTGSIIATLLALGKSVEQIKTLYLELGEAIFSEKESFLRRYLLAKFKPNKLKAKLDEHLGELTLGAEELKTGLAIVTKRSDTGGTWVFHNNPHGKYYEANKGILLKNIVRASTAAPSYFEPQQVNVGKNQQGMFVDGGVSMYNNPALLLFMMATLQGFGYHWEVGEDKLMITSIGTGISNDRIEMTEAAKRNNLYWALNAADMYMYDANMLGVTILQYLSESPTAIRINREIGDMKGDLLGGQKFLHYLRYNINLDENELNSLGFTNINLQSLREMSKAENRFLLADIGTKAAEKQVKIEHFPKSFDMG
ncbi:patatin-like phospholipase family protein [Runella limosa]|uniref:patatin-like phospholipase family protein n=1 Tax=Runella limosa TaxID=370978 RepID=UPI000413E688|nr:patatin-like phospholipase family protein [Runella limosa]